MTTGSDTLEVATPSDTEVVMSRTFDAPRELVFEALTKPEHLRNWMGGLEGWTMPVCEMDLRPGGAWRFVWRKDDGTEMEMTGEIREVSPPERFAGTENWGGDWPETLVRTELTEEDGRTTVSQTSVYPSKEARDAALATGMSDGAAISFERLAELLERLRG